MVEVNKNLSEVMDKAIETGEKIVTIECPCCGKTYYVLESEASFSTVNSPEEIHIAKKRLGRKCPYCGFAGMLGSNKE